ncbi:Enhancer of polycomb-like protein 1 [Thecaphora frezii]
MDEDDLDWLDTRNSKAREELALAMKNIKSGQGAGGGGGKGKGKERLREDVAAKLTRDNQAMLRIMTEDQFEMIMTVFEQVTSDRVPFLHLDMTKTPTLDSLLPMFDPGSSLSKLAQPELPPLPWEHQASLPSSSSSSSSSATNSRRQTAPAAGSSSAVDSSEWKPANPYKNLADLKALAGVVYPYWKSKREDREGRAVVPYLNFDETNDSDPYVCFRRREVKQMRKTRKTDALHIEKMIRLRSELEHAASLVQLIAQREKTKRASLRQDYQCWESARDLLDIKRQWGIVGPHQGLEDDELLSGEHRDIVSQSSGAPKKKRKTEEGSTTIKLSNRKFRSGEADSGSATSSTAAAAATAGVNGMGSAILERVHAVQAYIERECLRKADADLGWEEGSDSPFQPVPAPAAVRAFRPIHSETSEERGPFTPPQSRVGRPPSFRRRIGRGGRVFLDRRLPMASPVPSSLSDWPRPGEIPGRAEGAHASISTRLVESSRQGQASGPSARPESSVTEGAKQQSPALTGPFAFTPDLRPSLLISSLRAPPASIEAASLGFGGSFAASAAAAASSGPFASSSSAADARYQASDASSTSSDSTEGSRSSLTSIGAVSTQATEVGDIEMLGLDADAEKGRYEDIEPDSRSVDEEPRHLTMEEWSRLQERWRYDDETGRWAGLGLTGLGGMEDDEEAVLDDYDQKFMRYRMTLLEETDLLKLSTDLTNLQHAQAAAEAPSPKPAGYVQQASPVTGGGSTSTTAHSRSASAAAAGNSPALAAAGVSIPMPSAARTSAVTGGGGSQSALQAQQLQAQQQQLQLAMQQQAQQQQAAQAAAAAQQAAAVQQAQQHQYTQQPTLQQAQLAAMTAASQQQQQQQRVSSPATANQQRRASSIQAQPQQPQQQPPQQLQVQASVPSQIPFQPLPHGQPHPGQQQAPMAMPMQLPIQMQMQMQMQMAAAAAANMSGQPHPLSQSMSFDASSVPAQQIPRSMSQPGIPHSSPLQAAAFAVPNTQQFGGGMNGGINGLVGSPAMHQARMSSQPQQLPARTSSSPVSAVNGSGHNGARPTPSPVMRASMTVSQQMQRQTTGGAPNATVPSHGPQPKLANGFHALQALQQAQQAQPFVGHSGSPSTPQQAAREAQLMAMKAVLAQNANLQLRLPPNRALQIAQQAAQAALGQGQQQQQQPQPQQQQQQSQQQQQQQPQQSGQSMKGQGNASNQGSPNLMRASTAGSPRAKNAGATNNGMAQAMSSSPRAGMMAQAMQGQPQMQFPSSPASGNLHMSVGQQQALQQQQQQQLKAANMGMGGNVHLGMASSPSTAHAQAQPQPQAQHAATPNLG